MSLPEGYVLEQLRNRLAKTVNGRAIDLFEGDTSLAADWSGTAAPGCGSNVYC